MSVPVQVVLSANGGSIEGPVENGAGADGRFAFPLVAPGRYKVYAWENVDENAASMTPLFASLSTIKPRPSMWTKSRKPRSNCS